MARPTDIRIPVTEDEKQRITELVRQIGEANNMPLPSMATVLRALILGTDPKRVKLKSAHIAQRGRVPALPTEGK